MSTDYSGHLHAGSRASKPSVTEPNGWRDRLGICLSVLCLVHCLLTPFILGLVPVGAALGFWQHGFHQVFLLIVPFVALIAFIPGWRRHGDARVWYWGGSGILLLTVGVAVAEFFGHEAASSFSTDFSIHFGPLFGEILFTVAGGVCLIRAHLLNRALCVCCDHDHAKTGGA